jgi:hypothetical protein
MTTVMNIFARTGPAARVLSQRTMATLAHASSKHTSAAGELAAASSAGARKPRATRNSERKLSEAQLASQHHNLAKEVERQLQAQMKVVQAAQQQVEADSSLQAAAQHLQGIPLKSKREYKMLMQQYSAKRN